MVSGGERHEVPLPTATALRSGRCCCRSACLVRWSTTAGAAGHTGALLLAAGSPSRLAGARLSTRPPVRYSGLCVFCCSCGAHVDHAG